MKNKDIDFDNLIQVFNNEGVKAAKEYLKETYNASYTVIQRRIKEETNYYFNRNTRKYEPINESKASFMTLEELYMDKSKITTKSNDDEPDFRLNPHLDEDIFKDVVVNLMKDKMQEISKYINLEQSTKLALISIKRLEENGYKVILD